MKALVVALFRNVLLPVTIYLSVRPHVAEVWALSCTAAIPAVLVAYIGLRRRRVDVLGILVLIELLGGILIAATLKSPKLLLLKGPAQVGTTGMACLVSLAIDRPIVLLLLRFLRTIPELAALRQVGPARIPDRVARNLTLAWGCGLLLDAAVRVSLVFHLRTEQYLVASPLVHAAVAAVLAPWSIAAIRKDSGSSSPRGEEELRSVPPPTYLPPTRRPRVSGGRRPGQTSPGG